MEATIVSRLPNLNLVSEAGAREKSKWSRKQEREAAKCYLVAWLLKRTQNHNNNNNNNSYC